jgi:hypothetical protein
VSHNIDYDPTFVWWVPYVLKKRNIIFSAVTKSYHNWTHNFGIAIPKSWDKVMKLDKDNSNTLWQDAIRKEIEKCENCVQDPE